MSASREKKLRKETRDGGAAGMSRREQQERQDAFRRRVTTTVIVILLVAVIVLVLSGSGIMQANMTALTIDGVKIKGAEFDYHYYVAFYQTYEFYAMYGMYDWIDPNKSFRRQDAGGESWAQYFEDAARENLIRIVAQSEAAKKEGITLTDEDREGIDESIAAIELYAAQEGIKADRFLRNNYGRGITLKSYRAIIERAALSDRYRQVKTEAFGWSDEDFERYYDENRDRYDFIDFHSFSISGSPADIWEREYTEEELEDYREGQREKAEEMRSRVTTSDAFYALSLEYTEVVEPEQIPETDDVPDPDGDGDSDDTDGADTDAEPGADHDNSDASAEPDDNNKGSDEGEDGEGDEGEEDGDTTLLEKLPVSDLTGESAGFLTDIARRTGDTAVIEDENDFIVVLFLNRYREEGLYTEDEVKAKAESILEEWLAGDADEASFAGLARRYSADGNSDQGGIYPDVYQGQMVAPFDDWCFDPDRVPGDSGIVETQYGQHVMYFVGISEADDANVSIRHILVQLGGWKTEVKSAMDSEAYQEILTGLTEEARTKRHWFAMMFTKTKSS